MKKLIIMLIIATTALSTFAQKSATSPGTGHWIAIDSGYQVGTYLDGKTIAPLYFHNTSTSENITGLQFRLFYDNTAFTAVVPSLKISSTDQYIQYVDNNTNGYLTVTVVYTGTNSTFSYSNGATFDLTFTHAAAATFNTLDSIKTLKITGAYGFSNRASTNWGNDTTLTVYSYGGRFNQRVLRFAGKFINVTGTNAKNLWVSLEKKVKSSSTWTTVKSDKTNVNGHIVFKAFLDTNYWDTRMVVKGDTMTPGAVISTADAQKINQTVLGTYTPKGFDYYTMDVNGTDGDISIADAYSTFGRIAGRFTSWTKNLKDVWFFTESEYSNINGSSSNLTATYPGVNNFTYYINGKDSITYYVAVKGDANGTGFKMARITPIKIVNPTNANKHIIDNTVSYDQNLKIIEINMPKVTVDQGNLVTVPVKVLTKGENLDALQLEIKYDTSLLEFKKVELTEKIQKWFSFINNSNNKISFGAFDIANNNQVVDGENILNLQFIAKKPQDQWGTAALWTAEKFVGDKQSKDMDVIPTMGIVEVRRVQNGTTVVKGLDKLIVFPNPTQGEVVVEFKVETDSDVNLNVSDLIGKRVLEILNQRMPAGDYKYIVKLDQLANGMYVMSLQTSTTSKSHKIFINK